MNTDSLLYVHYINAGNVVNLFEVLGACFSKCLLGYGAAAGVPGGNGAKANGGQSLMTFLSLYCHKRNDDE